MVVFVSCALCLLVLLLLEEVCPSVWVSHERICGEKKNSVLEKVKENEVKDTLYKPCWLYGDAPLGFVGLAVKPGALVLYRLLMDLVSLLVSLDLGM